MLFAGPIFTTESLVLGFLFLLTIWIIAPVLAIYILVRYLRYLKSTHRDYSKIRNERLIGGGLITLSFILYLFGRNQSAAMPMVMSLVFGVLGCTIVLLSYAKRK